MKFLIAFVAICSLTACGFKKSSDTETKSAEAASATTANANATQASQVQAQEDAKPVGDEDLTVTLTDSKGLVVGTKLINKGTTKGIAKSMVAELLQTRIRQVASGPCDVNPCMPK